LAGANRPVWIRAAVLLVFMASVYQAIIPLFCCGTCACFLLFQDSSEYEPKIYYNLCLKLLVTLVGSVAVYFFIDRVIIPAVFHINRADYLDEMVAWKKLPAGKNIKKLLYLAYAFTFGNIPVVQNMVNPVIARNAGTGMVEYLMHIARFMGNALLFPAIVLFLARVIISMKNKMPKGRRLVYFLAGIGIPLCMIMLTLAGGNVPPIRSHYALPLASAFMFYFIIKTYKKKAAYTVACCALLLAFYQAQISAQLFYSDQMRYNEDVRLSCELNNYIIREQPVDKKLPVAIVGNYDMAARFYANYIPGEVIGFSVFGEYSPYINGLAFMESLGIHYDMPDPAQLEQAYIAALYIPPYPNPDCVKRVQDFIVVRLSESLDL